MERIKLYHFGCSFTENIIGHNLNELFSEYDYINLAHESFSNFKIFNTFENSITDNSIVIIQWSSITRPTDDNFSLMETSDNPLFDLLEQWYTLLEKTKIIAKDRNVQLIQYVGWAHWKDEELNEYHRNKLKSFDIHWFKSNSQQDIIQSNCFQFESPNIWSSNESDDGLYMWPELIWGGVAEWVRENVDVENRYVGYFTHEDVSLFDVHPSKIANVKFIENFLISEIKNKIE